MISKPAVHEDFSDANYQIQLTEKLHSFKDSLDQFGNFPIEVHKSKALGFRMRAEFRIWHEDGIAHYAMNHPGDKRPYIINNFPIGSDLITSTMSPLLKIINENQRLSERLFSVEFLTTLSSEILVTLIYHKKLDCQWETEAKILEKKLSIKIIGRAKKQKIVISSDSVTETLTVNGKTFLYHQQESGFTQPNAEINVRMLEWASRCCSVIESSSDLLELYCGNGNFTAVLAYYFNKILATEISKVSVASAERNFVLNKIDNVTVVRLSSDEIAQAIDGVRLFRRLKNSKLENFNFSTVFVDPPRAGLDSAAESFVAKFDNILYISCNPDTLMTNLKELTKTHIISKVAAFDQFPWTSHLETGFFLRKK